VRRYVARLPERCENLAGVAEYRHDTKYGPVEIFTKSIDDGWVAFVSEDQLPVTLAPDDGPVPLLEDEAVDRLLRRIEAS
jgi:hypothetical protein